MTSRHLCSGSFFESCRLWLGLAVQLAQFLVSSREASGRYLRHTLLTHFLVKHNAQVFRASGALEFQQHTVYKAARHAPLFTQVVITTSAAE